MATWQEDLNQIIVLPRAQQYPALRALLVQRDAAASEEWNTAFGAASLYEAFTQLPDAQNIYQANRAAVRAALETRIDWHIVEVGGGNGVLWRDFFDSDERGQFTLVDPLPETHQIVAGVLPAGVAFHSVVAPIQEAELPDADVVTCSLVLHHIAGLDANERRQYGLSGTGKRETLERLVVALRPRQGIGILTEADTYHDLALPPSDPLLLERFMESYFRRGATMVADAIATWTQMQRCASAGRSSCAIGSSTRSTRPSFRWRSVTFTSWMLRAGGNSCMMRELKSSQASM